MEPQDIDSHLLNGALRQLIFLTGLNITDAHHSTIFNAFVKKNGQRTAAAITYKMLMSGDELYENSRKGMSNTVESGGRASSPPFLSEASGNSSLSMRSGAMAMVKRRWPLKYLQERPALIVTFVDLDWDHPAWLEMRAECEAKINAMRQRIGQRETKLALVLIQPPKATSMDDPIANEKALELCQHCRLNSRLLFVFPRLSDDRALIERVNRLEKAFHNIAQEFYHACFKRIRSRNVPNNDAHLLVRQQYKLAFISELREDRHSALRYYKQAYQICHEFDVSDVDIYELCSVASLLNFKICELNFVLNSAVEAINQFRRHHNFFFKRESAFYPSRELAAIELTWWKAQQCRLFAELFSRAVSNGLAAYPSQNPGRFLGEAATHYKKANSLIRILKSKLAAAPQQRQKSLLAGDPLQSFDFSITTTYYGQRPWRMTTQLSDSTAQNVTKLPLLSSVNLQLLEHGAKLFLENNIHENYAHSLQLLSAAVAQCKRYGCERFANLSLFDMAEECVASQQFSKALQILHRLCIEDTNVLFYPFLREALVSFANAAFCSLSLNEWTWALLQLLHPQLANASVTLRVLSVDENDQSIWMENLQHFLLGDRNFLPFPLTSSANDHSSIFSLEQLNSFQSQWRQLVAQSASPLQFQLEMPNLNYSPIKFDARFLVINSAANNKRQTNEKFAFDEEMADGFQIATADDSLLIEVVLCNISNVPLRFEYCSLTLDEILNSSGAKKSKTLSEWSTAGNSSKNSTLVLVPKRPSRVFFIYKTTFATSLKQLMQLPASKAPTSRCQSPLMDEQNAKEILITVRHFSLRTSSGSLSWDIDHRLTGNSHHQNSIEETDKNNYAVK
ncbi:hypothetical protein niasHS_010148 [Heterodera schachtii]|uniref:Trafficking protein particle complex subunit 11 domain-containing protein n=1 Tax=Heterodera schachtii TaxID=97005 RepID=A0ABD2IYW4_HETSC